MNDYFAAKPAEELASLLDDKLTDWRSGLSKSGVQALWEGSFNRYYNRAFRAAFKSQGSQISRLGAKGELAGVPVNHFRNLLAHSLVLATNQKISYDVRAKNSDTESLAAAELGNIILDDYMHAKRAYEYLYRAAESAKVLGKGHVTVDWDPSAGKPYSKQNVVDEKTGQPMLDGSGQPVTKTIFDGDISFRTYYPWQVITDENEPDRRNWDWYAVVELKNKYTLAARYPKKREELLALPPVTESDKLKWFGMGQSHSKDISESLIEVVRFIHRKSEALPNGRILISAGPALPLYDGPTPYEDKLNLFTITPSEVMGSSEGYTTAFDLLPLQEAYDVLFSTIFSNQQALGLNLVWIPEGANLSKDVMRGLAVIKGPQGAEPKAISLVNTAEEIFKSLEVIERLMETIEGINSVARGNPDSSLDSGVALGLVQSMAVQFASGFQTQWAMIHEDVSSFSLWCLQRNVKTPRQLTLAGKAHQADMRKWTGESLQAVDRVCVDLGNPMSRTLAGRIAMADKYMDKGMVSSPQEYIEALQTGNVEPLIEGKKKQIDRIRMENDGLRQGKPQIVLETDTHLLDMQEHTIVVNDPELRQRAAAGDQMAMSIVQAAGAHIQEHLQKYLMQHPVLAAVAGEPPAPQPPMGPPPGAPMPPEGGAPQGPPPEQGPPQGPPQMPAPDPMSALPPPGAIPDGMPLPPNANFPGAQ